MSLEVQSTQSTHSIANWGLDGARAPSQIAGVSTSLLPEPGAGGLSGTQDALSMMYDLVAKQGEFTLALGEIAIATSRKDEAAHLSVERAALKAEESADASSGGFWSDFGSIFKDIGIAVGAVAAATVFTCGAAGVAIAAVAAVLISAGAFVSATKCLGKDSAYFALGADVAATVLTLGASSSAVATSAVQQAAQVVSSVATVAGGACDVAAGVAGIEVGRFDSESEGDAADVQQALNEINQQSRLMNEVIAGLKSSQESNKNALQIVAGAAQTYGQTSVIAASGGKA
jgi:hypothetical protein